MPILTEDIKLLKSAVMADVPEGGGAMTGIEVIDGQSNNLFPDTSTVDRAFGRVSMRKVYGVAHTDDVATALGAHVIITDAPDDPLVHCTVMAAREWAETRDTAQSNVEKYVVKGLKITHKLYDMHYAGSMQIKLVSLVPGSKPPVGGDGLVLLNPNGDEQFVRVLRSTQETQTVAVVEGGGTVLLQADVATCTLTTALAYDFLGPPPQRVGLIEADWARVYGTNLAAGAKFYGIKPLALAAAPGEYSVTTDGGIYSPLVPSATIESPIVDQYPLAGRSALAMTARATASISATGAVGPGVTLTLPAPIEPKSLSIVAGGTSFTDNGAGALLQGTTAVASIDYARRQVTFTESAPNYGTVAVTATFRPATRASASGFSAERVITSGTQGLAFTNAFEPPPAPGSFELDFMAQGRWYTLSDNLAGKLAGADASYGVGSISYTSGSMAVTLGALPDVGSSLIAHWGDSGSAKAVPGTLPARLSAALPLPGALAGGVVATWSHGTTNYTASTDAAGALSGDATGTMTGGELEFAPGVFPDGAVNLTYKTAAVANGTFTQVSERVFQAAGALPVKPGTVRGAVFFGDLAVFSDVGGAIRAYRYNALLEIGSINYATGVLTFYATASEIRYADEIITAPGGWQVGMRYGVSTATSTSIVISGAYDMVYGNGVEATHTTSITPSAWTARIETSGRETLLLDSALLTIGGDVYSSAAGVLRKGWSMYAGAPAVASAGVLTSGGYMQITSLPANKINAVVWKNLAQDLAVATVDKGVFRTASSPIKQGVMQLQVGDDIGSGGEDGLITGGGFGGDVDYQRGIVRWSHPLLINPAELSYNAVFLEYLPLDSSLIGLDTVRLPLDGKVPIYRAGDMLIVHNTLTTQLPNPLVKGTAYSLGRERIASVRVKDALGALVPSSLYVSDLDPGTLTVPAGSNLTPYTQPLNVEHRIEDAVVCSQADISGQLKFISTLTHDFPADTSFVSSALMFGDLFARAHNYIVQATWTGVWSDELIGDAPLADFNDGQYPVILTNRGAITERWALIFTNATTFRIIGENVGDIGTGNTGEDCAPPNPATGAAYWTLPVIGLGNGWGPGNVLRFNTVACGAPFWTLRTTLQGPATVLSDAYSLAFRLDVDRP